MEDAAGWLRQLNLEEVEVAESPARARAPVVPAVPPVLVPAEIPARPPMQAKGVVPVSYTHLTLPTNREV